MQLDILTLMSDNIRYFNSTIRDIQDELQEVTIFFSFPLMSGITLETLKTAMSPEYILSEIDFSAMSIDFKRVLK